MDGDGIERFYTDLKVDMANDPVTLVISYKMKAEAQGEYTYQQFKTGCVACGADSIQKWYKVIPDLRKELVSNDKLFLEVYNFTF